MKLQFNLPGTNKISQSLYEKFVLLSKKKKDEKNTQYLSKENYCKINVFIFNKLDFQNWFLTFLT